MSCLWHPYGPLVPVILGACREVWLEDPTLVTGGNHYGSLTFRMTAQHLEGCGFVSQTLWWPRVACCGTGKTVA